MSNVFYAIFVSIFWTDGASHSLFCKFKYKKCIFVLCAFRFFRHIDAVPKASYVPFSRTHRLPSAGQGRFHELWEHPADTLLFHCTGPRKMCMTDAPSGHPSAHGFFPDPRPHPYRVRPQIKGLSHGLKKCPPDTFSPRLRRGRPFESHQ